MSNKKEQPMKAKIQSFKPNAKHLSLVEAVLRQAIRNAYRKRHEGFLPTIQKWHRDDVRDAIKAYRLMQATEISHVD